MMNRKKKLIHVLAVCQDCDWDYGDYLKKDHTRKARQHSKKYGHEVHIETGYSQIIKEKKK